MNSLQLNPLTVSPTENQILKDERNADRLTGRVAFVEAKVQEIDLAHKSQTHFGKIFEDIASEGLWAEVDKCPRPQSIEIVC